MKQLQKNKKFKYLHPKDRIVMIMERVYGYEMTTTSGGNISIKDENGDIWVTPGAVDKGTLTRDDIVCVKPNGSILGKHKPSSEYPFHLAIYNARPDIKAVLHAHPPALVSFSAAGCVPRTDLLPNVEKICGEIDFVPYALPGSNELGQKIAQSFLKGCNSVLLENHGTVVGASDLFTAYQRFEMLDYTARIQIKAKILGEPKAISTAEQKIYEQKYNGLPEYMPGFPDSLELELRQEMCKFIHRSYQQKLFTSTEGTFACRLSHGDYLITPYGIDRKYISPEDIVLIKDGQREVGKLPSRSVLLHQAIFDNQPEINAVVIAHPPNLMAFNITDKMLDSKIIPEAYILLRDIQKLPFTTPILDHKKVFSTLNKARPISMFQNNGIIVTGDSLLTTFDRLEVAEYTAKAVLGAYQIGHVNSMGVEVIEELKVAFKLED